MTNKDSLNLAVPFLTLFAEVDPPAAELCSQEQGDDEGEDEQEDDGVEPEGGEDVRVVVEVGGDGDEEEDNTDDDHDEAVDHKYLQLVRSLLPSQDSVESFHTDWTVSR